MILLAAESPSKALQHRFSKRRLPGKAVSFSSFADKFDTHLAGRTFDVGTSTADDLTRFSGLAQWSGQIRGIRSCI